MNFLALLFVCATATALTSSEEVEQWQYALAMEDDTEKTPSPQASIEVLKYAAPNGMSNVTLVFGEKKLIVSRGFLAVQSPIFADLLTEGSGLEEVTMSDDVQYDEFVSLLDMVFPGELHGQISDNNARNILHLGNKFGMKHMENIAERYLIASDGVERAEKMLMADQYKLAHLEEHCLLSYHCVARLARLKESPEYSRFSLLAKSEILDRMMDLAYEENWEC